MAHIRTNREILTKGKSYANRKAKKYGTDEVTFNKESRLDYLTGFHKRKLHRQKMAAKFNEEQKRLQKIEERKKVAEERKREMEEKMRRFRESLDLDVEPEAEQNGNTNESDEENLSEESWHGFSDDEDESDGNELKSILKVKPVSKITYSDDTTVEIGSMEPNENFEFIAKMNNVKLEQSEKVLNQSITRATKYAKFLGMEDEDEESQKKKMKKKPKKKFRYLTKNERKENQRKAVRNKRRK